jgi:hypothetical protein
VKVIILTLTLDEESIGNESSILIEEIVKQLDEIPYLFGEKSVVIGLNLYCGSKRLKNSLNDPNT